MTLKLYATPGGFLEDNHAYLEANEAVTQLNRGNALANAGKPCTPELLFGRYEQDGQPVLLFGNTAPWNLCLNAPPQAGAAALQAIGELAAHLRGRHIEIAGVTGQDTLCTAFIKAHGGSFCQRSSMDIMVLKEVIPPPAVPGVVRPAEEKDLETIVQFVCAFHREALHQEADPETARQHNRERIEKGELRVLESPEGKLVSMAHTSRETERGISISGVYTPPEYRGHGYCQATVGSLCRELLAGGKHYCTLFVDKKNPISNRVYRKIGFVAIEDCSEYKLEG